MSIAYPGVDIDEVMRTPGGAVVFVVVTWPDGTTQRGSVAFEQPIASRMTRLDDRARAVRAESAVLTLWALAEAWQRAWLYDRDDPPAGHASITMDHVEMVEEIRARRVLERSNVTQKDGT